MKKIILLSGLTMLTLSSCKKDWTCACTFSNGGSSSTTIVDKTKSDAKAECNSGDGSVLGVTIDCELK